VEADLAHLIIMLAEQHLRVHAARVSLFEELERQVDDSTLTKLLGYSSRFEVTASNLTDFLKEHGVIWYDTESQELIDAYVDSGCARSSSASFNKNNQTHFVTRRQL